MLAVRVIENHICVKVPFPENEVAKTIPGRRWHNEWKAWVFPKTPATARAIVGAFGRRIADADQTGEVVRLADIASTAAATKIVEPAGEIGNLKTIPWRHQRQAYAFAMSLPGVMLNMGMGTGKSLTTVAILANRARRALILCPKSVVPVWPLEFSRHCASDFRIVTPQKGTLKKRTEEADRALAASRHFGHPVAIVINYEAAWLEPFASWAIKAGFDHLVMDECHRIKAPNGKASRFCSRLSDRVEYRLGLTGTPMTQGPLDLYGQMRAIDKGVFGTNHSVFKARYAVMGGFGNRQVVAYQRLDELREKLDSVTFHASRDVLDLPAENDIVVPVELGAKARKISAELDADLYAAIEGGEITAANALVKILRMQQVTSGYVKTDEGNLVPVDDAKATAFADFLEGLPKDEPVVVFCRFTTDFAAVRAACGAQDRRYAELSGARNDLAAWQAGGSDVLAVQYKAGGVGVDMTRSCLCAFFSFTHSLGDYEQARARVSRPGQTRPVRFFHFKASGTIDEKIVEALQKKRDVVDFILSRTKAGRL